MREWISKLAYNPDLRNRLLGSYSAAKLFQWANSQYLKRFDGLDVRYFRWLSCLERTRDLPGDIVELGVGPGRFLVYCASWMKRKGADKQYWGYDTFAGFPSVTKNDKENLSPDRRKRVFVGNYAFSKDRIEGLVERFRLPNVTLVQGNFSDTLAHSRPERVSFLYIDCDLYEGYKAGLEALYDRLVPGGIVLFDEYDRTHEWPGARKAVDEFFADKREKPRQLEFSPSYYVKKEAAGNGA